MKQFILDQIDQGGVRDESDRKSRLRLVIEPRSSRRTPTSWMAMLLVHTSLESRYAVNLTWLGLDGLPETKGIVEVLREWASSASAPCAAAPSSASTSARRRLHIVEGRLKAYAKIDEVHQAESAPAEDQAEANKN